MTLEASVAGRCQETAAGLAAGRPGRGAGSAALAAAERGVGIARSGSQSKDFLAAWGTFPVRRRPLELADEIADAHLPID